MRYLPEVRAWYGAFRICTVVGSGRNGMQSMAHAGSQRRREAASWAVAIALVALCGNAGAAVAFPLKSNRVLFLGDSITHAGGYIAWIEMQCRLQGMDPLPEFINVGLSSETCTGLSEPDHPFPRPDIHERLDRALQQVQPDVVVACYGMNDGIYYCLLYTSPSPRD